MQLAKVVITSVLVLAVCSEGLPEGNKVSCVLKCTPDVDLKDRTVTKEQQVPLDQGMEEWSTRGGVKVAVQVSHCLFCMGAYKCDVVVVIKMGGYIHGVLIIPILRC